MRKTLEEFEPSVFGDMSNPILSQVAMLGKLLHCYGLSDAADIDPAASMARRLS